MITTQSHTSTELVNTVRRILADVWSGKNPDALEELYSPNYVRHDPYAAGIVSHAGIRKLVKIYRDAFPDLTIELIDESLCVGENRVAAQYWISGTHTGKFLQIEPANRSVLFTGTGVWRMDDEGRLEEDWHNFDTQTFFTALGILPCIGEFLEDH